MTAHHPAELQDYSSVKVYCTDIGVWFVFFFLSGKGQRPHVIYGSVFIKVSECSGLTSLDGRSDAWFCYLCLALLGDQDSDRRVMGLNI